MIERKWKLGEDVSRQDSVLDGFTFEQLIISLRSGSKKVDEAEIRKVAKEMLDIQLEDMNYLIDNNINEIIEAVIEGREN